MEPSDPTEPAGVANASTEMIAAWSLEDPEPPAPRIGAQTITALGVSAGVIAVAASVWLAIDRFPSSPHVSTVVERVPAVIVPPVTITSTVQASPQDLDAEFLDAMRNAGWRIVDPSLILRYAHWYCDNLGQGQDPKALKNIFAKHTPTDMDHAENFASIVVSTYGCQLGRSG